MGLVDTAVEFVGQMQDGSNAFEIDLRQWCTYVVCSLNSYEHIPIT